MKAKHLLYALFMLIGSAAAAQTAMPEAQSVLDKAYAQASKENKKVILMFHASWCGWCKRMDASLVDPTCKKFFDDNYVVAHLDVMEEPAKVTLENPGGMAAMNKFGGDKNSGLPFWLVLDAKGNVLANSLQPNAKGVNESIGCPASEKEVAFFDAILKKTSNLTDEEIAVIHKRFRQNEPVPVAAKGTK